NDPVLFNAVMVGTIAGSQALDFDTILKMKSNAVYIRNHRGVTHSLPAILMWGVLIAGIIHAFAPRVDLTRLWAWRFLAVVVHVLVDIFNAYGTQAYRPFSNRWVAYGFINTFDPYIFLLHIGGIIAWILGANPGYTWLIVYTVIALYYVKRYLDKREIVKRISDYFPDTKQIATSPTMQQNSCRVAITTTDKFYVGKVEHGHIQIVDEFDKVPLPDTKLMRIVRKDTNVQAF